MPEIGRVVCFPETSAKLRSVTADRPCIVIEFEPYAARHRTKQILKEFRLSADEPLDFSGAFLAARDPERS